MSQVDERNESEQSYHVPSIVLELNRITKAMILTTNRHIAFEATVVGETATGGTIDASGVGRNTVVGVANRKLTSVDVSLGKLCVH